MAIEKEKLDELCDLFPVTHDAIKKKALYRRNKFMIQKRLNSKPYLKKFREMPERQQEEELDPENHIPFMEDEELEDNENKNEDLKVYMNQLNKKLENMVESLK
jgi:hypothetical protein